MLSEVGLSAEGAPTFLTLAFLSAMNSLMRHQVGAVMKGFPTLITLTRFLPRVNFQVLKMRWMSSESAPTSLTHVGLLPSVNSDAAGELHLG